MHKPTDTHNLHHAHTTFFPLLCLAMVALLSTAAPATEITDQQLWAKAQEAWRESWTRFYDERTHLFYDYVDSNDPARRRVFLPTPEEIARKEPNRNGWGTGMEDCAISAGVMLSMICDRFAATQNESLRVDAEKVFAGMVLLGKLSPSGGFVIRGVSPVDGRSHFDESSRDQYTWYAYGLWRYYRSPLASPDAKAKIREILTAVCTRLERNVVAQNGYHIGREDGSFDGRVDSMWNNAAHEIARLPMIYAIGADVTGDARWRDAARRLSAEAAERSKGDSTKLFYAMLQQQVSLAALYELEEDPELKAAWLDCMQLVAHRAEAGLRLALDYRPQGVGQLNMDWRTWTIVNSNNGYRVPQWPAPCREEDRTVRQPAEAALVLLLLPQPTLTPEQVALMKQSIAQVDYARMIIYGLYYTQAAYWRGVRLGLFKLPEEAAR